MSWLSKALRSKARIMGGPASIAAEKYYDKNKGSTLTRFFMPGEASLNRLDNGASWKDSVLDPGGYYANPTTPHAHYTQQGELKLSPGAQALYTQMKARSAARTQPQTTAPTTAPFQSPVAPPMPKPMLQPIVGQQYADGGRVRGKSKTAASTSKVITHKPNGKPY